MIIRKIGFKIKSVAITESKRLPSTSKALDHFTRQS